MALIVEDGSIVPNANSYISYADAVLLAAQLGVTISAVEADGELQLSQAAFYNDSEYASRFTGSLISADQTMQWPRQDAMVNGFDFPDDAIPSQLLKAQVLAASYIEAGVNFYAVDDGKNIASEEVTGAVKVSYFDNGKSGSSVNYPQLDACLNPVLNGSANGGTDSIYSMRVRS